MHSIYVLANATAVHGREVSRADLLQPYILGQKRNAAMYEKC